MRATVALGCLVLVACTTTIELDDAAGQAMPGHGAAERAEPKGPARPPSDDTAACLRAPGAGPVDDFGPFIPDRPDRKAVNTATINRGLDTVGRQGGGTICLPAGRFYLTNRAEWPAGTPASIGIAHSNVTLWGAGAGRTVLHTASEPLDGVRGHGLVVPGTTGGPPQRNIVLRDFELDGGAGWTGCYDWGNGDPDCWDITHKGIIVGVDAAVDDVLIQDVYVHRYRGELLYTAGLSVGRLTLRRVAAEDGNASTFNMYGARLLVEDSRFGRARFWMELIARANAGGYPWNEQIFRNNRFHDNGTESAGVVLAQGDGTPMSIMFVGNAFERSHGVLGLYGGVGGPVRFSDNRLTDVDAWALSFADFPGAETAGNGNLLFSGNTIIGAGGLTALERSKIWDITIRDNVFAGRGAKNPTSLASVRYGADAELENVIISGNEFRNCLMPHRTGRFVGTPPHFNNNRFIACADELAGE